MMSMAGDAVLLSATKPRSSSFLRRSFLSQFLAHEKGSVVLENTSSHSASFQDHSLVHDCPSAITMDRSFLENQTASTKPAPPTSQNQRTTRSAPMVLSRETKEHLDNVKNRREEQTKPTTTESTAAVSSTSNDKQDTDVHGFALEQMAEAQAQMHRWETAFELWDQALTVQTKRFGNRHISIARTLHQRGVVLAKLGYTYESILDLERAYSIQRESQQNDDSNKQLLQTMADTLLELARAQQKHRSYVEAMQSLQQCLEITKIYAKEEKVASLYCVMAKFYHQRRRFDQALESYKTALEVYKQAGLSNKHPKVLLVQRRIADRNMLADGFWTRARNNQNEY